MQYSLSEIKRLNTCPILFQKRWDYKTEVNKKIDPTVRFGINQIFKWHSRRGNPITYDVLSSAISQHFYQTKRSDQEKLMEITNAFKDFLGKGFYSKINEPVFNHEIIVNISEGNTLKYKIPLLTFHSNILYCIFYDRNPNDFYTSLESQIITMWAFYTLDQYPRFLFFDYEDGEIKTITKRYNIDYIQESKRNLALHGLNLNEKRPYPITEICDSCERRNECPRITKKWLKE